MADDKKRGGDEGEDVGPGLVYMPFVVMEELLDKLRLLDYEKDFVRKLNLKPINRYSGTFLNMTPRRSRKSLVLRLFCYLV